MDTRQLEESNSWTVIATVMVLTPVSTIFVVSRVYSCHVVHRRRLSTEEWLSVISLTFLWLGAAFATKLSLSGGGRHWVLLTDAERTSTRFWYWLWTFPAGFILSVPNMAVVSLVCRLFKPRRWHVILLWSIAVVCNVNFVFGFILQLFRCKPLRVPWDAGAEQCWDQWVYIKYCLYAAVYSAVADFCLAVYPALVLRQLAWSHKKVALCFMLGLSIFATGVASYKTPLLRNIASDDFSYDISALVIWTMVEGYVILLAACLPTLHPAYDRVTGRSKTMRRNTCPCPPRIHLHHHHHHRRASTTTAGSISKQNLWSAIFKPSFGSSPKKTAGSAGSSRRWSVNGIIVGGVGASAGGGGGRTTTVSSTVDMAASLRTLEDAANLAYPPATIWKQTVRVGQHSRIRPQHHDSF